MSDNKDSAFERFCSFDAMYDASYRVCRNVRWKDSTIDFEENRIETILQTEADLRANEYQQLVFSCFSIIERGKPRDIRACHIKDRLVQNTLCEEVLLPDLTPKFVYDNCATLKGKGIDFALKRTKQHLQQAHREYGLGKSFYVLRIDIKKYFDSINHKELKRIASKVVKDEKLLELINYLIDTFSFKITYDEQPIPGKDYYISKNSRYVKINIKKFKPGRKYYEYDEKSLGLGSQTSQLFALLMLNEVDHYIKEELHIKRYNRYMDDSYLIHNDSAYLEQCRIKIQKKLTEVGLQMNMKKTAITRIDPIGEDGVRHAPFKYLKWNFYITDTNHIIQLPFKSKISHQRRKLKKMHNLWLEGKITNEEIQTSYQGWRAHISRGTCFYVIQNMDNYFRSLFKGVEIK